MQSHRAGVLDDQVYVDPLALAISIRTEGALIALETMRALRSEYPAGRIVA
jgi:hypothetical protein